MKCHLLNSLRGLSVLTLSSSSYSFLNPASHNFSLTHYGKFSFQWPPILLVTWARILRVILCPPFFSTQLPNIQEILFIFPSSPESNHFLSCLSLPQVILSWIIVIGSSLLASIIAYSYSQLLTQQSCHVKINVRACHSQPKLPVETAVSSCDGVTGTGFPLPS